MKRIVFLLLATFIFTVITSCANKPSEPSKAAAVIPPTNAKEEDKQWTMANKDYSATRYSSLNSITTENVKNLKVAWTFSTRVLPGPKHAPLPLGTTMYLH